MKALVKLLETVQRHGTSVVPAEVASAALQARAELDQINADAESARNDPNDSVSGLYRLAEMLERHGLLRREEDHLRPIAEEVIYLRQWPAVIDQCDEIINQQAERIAELEQRIGEAIAEGYRPGPYS